MKNNRSRSAHLTVRFRARIFHDFDQTSFTESNIDCMNDLHRKVHCSSPVNSSRIVKNFNRWTLHTDSYITLAHVLTSDWLTHTRPASACHTYLFAYPFSFFSSQSVLPLEWREKIFQIIAVSENSPSEVAASRFFVTLQFIEHKQCCDGEIVTPTSTNFSLILRHVRHGSVSRRLFENIIDELTDVKRSISKPRKKRWRAERSNAMVLLFRCVFVLGREIIELSVFFINRRSDSSIWKKRNKWTAKRQNTRNKMNYATRSVDMNVSFILSSLGEFGGRRIRIHSNVHFHNWTTNKRYHSRMNQSMNRD